MTAVCLKRDLLMIFINSWCDQHRYWNYGITYQIFWSGVQCCGTSLCCGWGDWTYGTRSHQSCPHFPHRPAWGDLQWPLPPGQPVSGTGSSCPPPPPALTSWRGIACSHVPVVRNHSQYGCDTQGFRLVKIVSKMAQILGDYFSWISPLSWSQVAVF